MFGAIVSEMYLLIKLVIDIERTVDLCVITKKKYTRIHRNCESGLAITIQACCTQDGPAHAAGHGDGMDR